MSFQKKIKPKLVVLVCWKQVIPLQNPVFELKNYWIPGKRGDVYEGAVVSTITPIFKYDTMEWTGGFTAPTALCALQHTDPMWSDITYRASSLDKYMQKPVTWKKSTHRETMYSVHAWTITQILRNYYTHLLPTSLLSSLNVIAPCEGEGGHQQLRKKYPLHFMTQVHST